MLSICLRTDKPEAELLLFEDAQQVSALTWQAHRELAETIHFKIDELLHGQHKQLADLSGIVVYRGPGSFTGLRIGLSVANALAYSLSLPIVGATGDNWQQFGVRRLLASENEISVLPEYGSGPHITLPKK